MCSSSFWASWNIGRIALTARSVLAAGVVGGLLACAAEPVAADLININFTSTAYSGTNETSPATPGGSAGTWNNFTSAADWETDAKAVLLADGSAGPTLAFDSTSGSGTFNWSSTSLSLSTVDYTTSGGAYNVANLYESGLINSGNNTTAFRIKGLSPGSYEVFVVPAFRGAQAAGVKSDPNVTFSIGLGNDTDARNSGGLALTSTGASATQHVDTRLTTWVAATDGTSAYNYLTATLTIDSASRWLTIILPDSASSGPDRAGISTLQIRSVAVPEASALLFVGGIGSVLFGVQVCRRRTIAGGR